MEIHILVLIKKQETPHTQALQLEATFCFELAGIRSPGASAGTHLLSTHTCTASYGPGPQQWAPFLHRASVGHYSGVLLTA